jgi:chaperonin GroES
VVVKIDAAETRSPGGIVVVSQEKVRPSTGVVVKIGPGRPLAVGGYQKIDLNIGDHVMFTPYAGMTVESGITRDDDHLLLREEDIVAVLQH